jgi:hypothetical protein
MWKTISQISSSHTIVLTVDGITVEGSRCFGLMEIKDSNQDEELPST